MAKQKMVIAYYVKDGSVSPDGKVTANNDNQTNVWKIIAKCNPANGWIEEYECLLCDKNNLVVGNPYYGIPVIDSIICLNNLISNQNKALN